MLPGAQIRVIQIAEDVKIYKTAEFSVVVLNTSVVTQRRSLREGDGSFVAKVLK